MSVIAEDVEMKTVEVNGVSTAYRRKGSGEPLLYLHGLGMTKRWLPLYEHLAAHYDVIVPEHPGFGDSELPDWLNTFDDVVLHYASLLRVLQVERVHLVGHSFGAWIAAEFAVFYPERLRSLTLITPFGLRVEGHTPRDVYRMSHERFMDESLNGRGADFDAYISEGDESSTLIQSYAERTALGRIAWNPRYDYRLDRRLAAVEVPALVLGAQEDRILPGAHVERYADLLPQARVDTISGTAGPTGHAVVLQEPEAVTARIVAFTG